MTARPGKAHVIWTDGIGLMQRELDVARACNRCDCTARVRLDKSGGLMPPKVYGEPLYVPVECGNCGWWYAVEAQYAPPHVHIEPEVQPVRVPVRGTVTEHRACIEQRAYMAGVFERHAMRTRPAPRSVLERLREAWRAWKGER